MKLLTLWSLRLTIRYSVSAAAIVVMRPSATSVDKRVPSIMQHDLPWSLGLFIVLAKSFMIFCVIFSCFGNHGRDFRRCCCCLAYLGYLYMTFVDFYNKQQNYSSLITIICLHFVTEKHCVYRKVDTEFLCDI